MLRIFEYQCIIIDISMNINLGNISIISIKKLKLQTQEYQFLHRDINFNDFYITND